MTSKTQKSQQSKKYGVPDGCKTCQHDQCPLECPQLEDYQEYLRNRRLAT